MNEIIQPRILKGFRDFLPQQETIRAGLIDTVTAVFRSFGFVPIDTPVLEYSDILLRKSDGETEKQVFRFKDNGERDVALRFDLTVPFARFVAEHREELPFPFKRYHVAKVWRGEKPQAGRYREFVQCDFDIVGSESVSSDFEILLMIKAAFEALEVPAVTVRLNHRGLFNAFLARIGIADKSEGVLRAIDKLGKIGREQTAALLTEVTGSAGTAEEILAYTAADDFTDFDATVSRLEDLAGGSPEAARGIGRLRELGRAAQDAAPGFFVLDPSITRGLDYYTGIVYETFLNDLPEIGSVCSGGRYDNLAGLYMKERLPGVGASIGLDRLVAALEKLAALPALLPGMDALIFCQDASLFAHYHRLAASLRARGMSVEVYPDPKPAGKQYQYAEKKGTRFAVLCTPEDAARGVVSVKNLANREIREHLTAEEMADIIA
ncbi:MAG: histidine--tRNA ligase [Spirochaetaceae bacterium]|jgi:histidyl-tRNA synthetase|nr:histidine--tRNA ligase [Spirochaetaceae bacterium]